MSTPRPVVASSFAYELGAPRRLSELPELAESPDLLAAFTSEDGGLRYYLEATESPYALAHRSARQTLEASDVSPEEIGVVLFASDSLSNAPAELEELGRFLKELGLDRAYAMSVALSDCANCQAALRLATGLVRSGEAAHVLVVSVDVAARATPDTRVIGAGTAVASDAAASCLVSHGFEGFEIKRLSMRADLELLGAGGRVQAQLGARLAAHRALFDALFGKGGGARPPSPASGDRVSPARIKQVFPNNFMRSVVRAFLADSGFAPTQVYFDNIPRVGHCLGSDCLINLVDYARRHTVSKGEQFVLLGAGAAQLGAVLLEAM